MTQLYPALLEPRTLTRQVWDVGTAQQIPGVGRALGIIGGLFSQMQLDLWRGMIPLARPSMLESPSTDLDRPTFVRLQVEDYLLQGNAAHLITARDRDGWPASGRWYPAHRWHCYEDNGRRRYFLDGVEVSRFDVVHVQNGADPLNLCRGMGVVERYVRSLDRVASQEEAERQNLTGGSVPSVAVILPPDDDSTDADLDDAADEWEDRFGGGPRRPGFLPHGTEVKPLSWSPHDSEMVAARELGLQDVANIFNLDGYWLGTRSSSHTYRSPAPLFVNLLRTTLEPILAPFEFKWSERWVPRGKRIRFDREAITGDDFASTITTLTKASGGPIMTVDESRGRVGLGPIEGGDVLRTTAVPDTADPAADPADPTQEGSNA